MDKEQARKLYELADRLSKLDVNTLSEKQLAERSAMIARLQEVKQRLDPKCWDGYKKQGTKIKGGVRVNNCVPESTEQGVAEGSDHSLKQVWDRYSKHLQAGRGDHSDIKQINKSGKILQDIRKYVKDHHGQKAVDDMERYAERRQWDEGYTVTRGIDRERYQERQDLEGPFSTKSGKVVYYDKAEGKYYDPDTDMYIEYADWQAMNESDGEYNDEAGMAESNLHTMARAVAGLIKTIEDNDNLPEWAQEKIAKAEMMITSVWDYLLSQKEQGVDPKVQGVAEGQETPESELERLKLRQNAEHGGASLQRQSETQARIRELEKQIKDKKSVAEAKKPSPKLTPVEMKKTDPVSEEINTEAYERLQKVFAFKNYES